jgi:hypothetical protein
MGPAATCRSFASLAGLVVLVRASHGSVSVIALSGDGDLSAVLRESSRW